MFLKRFYDEGLAQASWMIGCAATGEAIVIDANRDVTPYLDAAKAERLRITHVSETHIHADFVSGSRELAAAAKARLHLSAEGGDDWQYAFATSDGAVLLHDGDVIKVGNIRLEVMHTPGHTPEHLCFIVTDTAGASEPMGVVTGDFVFVGDVGRPDLLERAAKVAGTMEASARQLFKSLERFRALPDFLQVWPGHGAGSACGKSLGAVPTSTVGYEKRYNWAVGTTDEKTFLQMVLAGQPEPPTYFAEMKRINRVGPKVLGHFPDPPKLGVQSIEKALAAGSTIIDTRTADEYAKGHITGTINIPLNKSFVQWAGWLVRHDVEIHLITTGADATRRAIRDLAMIGLDHVVASHGMEVVVEWRHKGNELGTIARTDIAGAAPRIKKGEVTVLDVRNANEFAAGHLPGAIHIPLGHLQERLGEIPRDKPILVHCQSGGRSAIASSVLAKHGVGGFEDLRGGFSAWAGAGHKVER